MRDLLDWRFLKYLQLKRRDETRNFSRCRAVGINKQHEGVTHHYLVNTSTLRPEVDPFMFCFIFNVWQFFFMFMCCRMFQLCSIIIFSQHLFSPSCLNIYFHFRFQRLLSENVKVNMRNKIWSGHTLTGSETTQYTHSCWLLQVSQPLDYIILFSQEDLSQCHPR